jgi:hypothetical protein
MDSQDRKNDKAETSNKTIEIKELAVTESLSIVEMSQVYGGALSAPAAAGALGTPAAPAAPALQRVGFPF